jgi:hypothetical protein
MDGRRATLALPMLRVGLGSGVQGVQRSDWASRAWGRANTVQRACRGRLLRPPPVQPGVQGALG